jgi:hypothetical protein
VTDDGGLPVALPSVSVGSAGTGHGIIGMRERVHLCGGTFSTGPLPDGGFQVTATLPLPTAGVRMWAGLRTDDGIGNEASLGTGGGLGTGAGTTAAAASRSTDPRHADSRPPAVGSTPATAHGTPAVTGGVTGGGGGRG